MLYALRMAPLLRVSGFKKVIAAQVTIDESTGVALSQEKLGTEAMKQGFWLTGFGVYIFWNIFTLLGALGAKAMGDSSAWGLDAAVPAAFLGLVWPRLTNKLERALAVCALVLAVLLSPVLSAGLPIISTVVLAVIFGWKVRR
jgi:predicted branched-subunit amino acid permease